MQCIPTQWRSGLTLTMAIAAMLTLAATVAHGAETFVRLDGTKVKAELTGIDATGKVIVKTGDAPDELMALRRIDRAAKVNKPGLFQLVLLRDGGRIHAQHVSLADGDVIVDWAHGDDQHIPLDRVSAVLLNETKDGSMAPIFASRVEQKPREQDWLFARKDKDLITLEGAVEGLNDTKLSFVWSGEQRTADRDKVYGLVFAEPARARDMTGEVGLTLTDGSVVWGELQEIKAGRLTLAIGDDHQMALPWSAVVSMVVRSDRMTFASDLVPRRVQMMTLFTFTGWERDQSVMRRPITLNGQVYEKGIGAVAVCRLTYDVDGRYDEFAATIGIDDETEGRGDCEFVVLGDGRELLLQRMRGGEKAKAIRVDIDGVRQVTLALEMGENATVGDHGDWADARFIREQD